MPTVVASPVTPGYRWESGKKRYIDARGRVVSFAEVRRAVDQARRASRANVQALSQKLSTGKLSLPAWQRAMSVEIRNAHLAAAASARGGWAALTPADKRQITADLKEQHRFLAGFAQQLKSGEQPLGPGFERRALMYMDATHATFEATKGRNAEELGLDQERNILGAADHCKGCLSATARGWQPIGSLVPVGQRDCLTNDRCHLVYRNSAKPNQAPAGYGA